MEKLKTCRCCLKEIFDKDELHEFSSEVATDFEAKEPINFIKINQCYLEVTSLEIPLNEEDNNMICSGCLGDLRFSYIFKKKCIESAKELEKAAQESYAEDNEEVHDEEEVKYEEEPYDGYVIEELVDEIENIEEFRKEENDSNDEGQTLNDPLQVDNNEPEEEIKIKCQKCPKTFDRKDSYRRHYQRFHLEEDNTTDSTKQKELLQCDSCGKISLSRKEFEEHQMEHESVLFKCVKCEKSYSTREEAQKHLETHSTEYKPYACETCSKTFKNRYQLVIHTRTHTGEKPFECPVCKKTFSMSSNLQKHMDTHSNDKPYGCRTCGSCFKTQRSLKFHVICHHQPEAKIKCPTCDKSFVNKSYLKVHMLYHTGQKNFTCTICSSKYYKSSHLKRHIQNVHFKLRLMKCDYCASDFVRKETYKAHIISHHKRHMTDQEFVEVLENIRKFQPPHLDVDKFTVEKQGKTQLAFEVVEEEMEEIIENEIDKSEECMMEGDDEFEMFEETDDVDNAED